MKQPQDYEAEQGLIGAMLLDPESVLTRVTITPDDFIKPRHKIIYESLLEMHINNMPIDSITIGNYLKHKDVESICGGVDYLHELMDKTLVAAHFNQYQEIVVHKSKLRNEMKVLQDGLDAISNDESASDKVISSLVGQSVVDNSDEELWKLGEKWIDNVSSGNTGHLGWWTDEWDQHLTKLSSELCIIHAPRSTGKTAWLLQYICKLQQQGMTCSFASIEMIKQELLPRLIAHLAQLNTYTMRTRGWITEDEKKRSIDANEIIKSMGIRVRDGSMNIMEIRAWALNERKKGSQAIFIDNLLCINDGGKSYVNRTAMYDYFIQQLLDLRNDIKIPIFLLAHPSAEGLVAYSRNIENLCDVILYLHTVPYDGIDLKDKTIHKRLDISGDHVLAVFQKNRQGLSPAASLSFNKDTQTFKHLNWEE